MATGDLCVLADVKAFLNITNSTADDAILARLITATSSRIAQYIQRTIGTGTITQTLNGSGTNQIFLGRWPLTAITSLTVNSAIVPLSINGSAGYIAQIWDGSSIPIPEPVVSLTGGYGIYSARSYGPGAGTFTKGNSNVSIVYTAGFTTVPTDLAQACIELVMQSYNQRLRIGQNSVNQATQQINFQTKMLESVKEALQPYKRVTPMTL